MFEQGNMEQGLERSGQTFDECWSVIRELYSEVLTRPQLSLHIEIGQNLNFDSLLATYLFRWNPELPDVTTETFVINPSLDCSQILDSTGISGDNRLVSDSNTSLTVKVLRKLQIQKSFEATILVLTNFGQSCYLQRRVMRIGADAPSERNVELFDIVGGVRLANHNDYVSMLTNAWSVFDQFLNSNLLANDSRLMAISNFRNYYNNLVDSNLLSNVDLRLFDTSYG